MTHRWTLLVFSALLACLAARVTLAASDAEGIVPDACSSQKTPEQVPAGQWTAYIFAQDFGRLCQYRAQNARLAEAADPPGIVFMGDSITEFWAKQDPTFFTEGRIDRGISGQTTSQMLLRFRQDVIALHPRVVHILAGTNDVAGNTGPSTLEQVEGNIASMAELAHANGIEVILGSIPPAARFPWRPAIAPVATIRTLNAWIRRYAQAHGFTYVDYYSAMATPEGGMKAGLADDGVHPTRKGYAIMGELANAAIESSEGRH